MTQEEKERLMSLGIEEKVAQSKKVIKEAIEKFGAEKLAVAWTGGKDSTTMTWLFREACKELSVPMPSEIDILPPLPEIDDSVQTYQITIRKME